MPGANRRKFIPGTTTAVANPAAGANFSLTVPATYTGYGAYNNTLQGTFPPVHKLVAVRFGLTTSATAANRFPAFYVTDPSGNVIALVQVQTAQTASLGPFFYTFALGVGNLSGAGVASQQTYPCPDNVYLTQNSTVNSLVNGIQAGDQLSSITVSLEPIA